MVQRWDYFAASEEFEPFDRGEWVKYEDYAMLKAHAHAMAMAMLHYDCGERVSFQPYKDYLEWVEND
jgi:hypothetical protein